MSRRGLNILLGGLSLTVGGLLYICFREGTYVAQLLSCINGITELQAICRPIRSHFLRYYLPDFLWGLSLGCYLQAVHLPERHGVFICGSVVVVLGAGWEFAQFMNIVSGTADLLDVLMYLAAGVVTVIMNYKERKK